MYELLASLVNLPRFTEDVDDAHDMIAGLDGVSDDVIRETAGSLFLEWLWLDYILHTGVLAQFALRRHERDLNPGGRRFLRACLDAPMRLLQVTRVEPGVRVEVNISSTVVRPYPSPNAAAAGRWTVLTQVRWPHRRL